MENPFRKFFKNNKDAAKATLVATAITAAVEGVEAQTNNNAEQFLKDNNINPNWNIDMRKYPGMHPSKAFELESYEKLDIFGKIEWTRQAIEAEIKNLELDKKMGESEEQLKKVQEEIDRLKNQLADLENQLKVSA